MQYTPDELFVGALDGAANCTTETAEHEIWPKFMLMVILQGAQRFVIDGAPFSVDAGAGATAAPVVFMLNVARHSRLRFLQVSAEPLRKVMISAPLPWLERVFSTAQEAQPAALRAFFAQHLASFSFAPGQNILQLASKIMAPLPILSGELQGLYLRAQALDIMWQSCLALVTEKDAQAPSLMSLRQCEAVRDFVLANLERDLTMDMIARAAGASASTVQRRFREHFGIAIFDFIRLKRLEAARTALARDGVPVAQAAHLAGYNDASSFTTAFRKAFGVTPRQVRA